MHPCDSFMTSCMEILQNKGLAALIPNVDIGNQDAILVKTLKEKERKGE